MIPTISRVVHNDWPQVQLHLLGPMNGMQHHNTCPIGNGFDRTLGGTILVVSTNTQKGDILSFVGNIIIEFDGGEMCVASLEFVNLDIELRCYFLKRVLSFQRFIHTKRHLVVVVDETRLVVNEDGAPCEASFMLLFPKGGRQATCLVGQTCTGLGERRHPDVARHRSDSDFSIP
jgi:hypothetical protein